MAYGLWLMEVLENKSFKPLAMSHQRRRRRLFAFHGMEKGDHEIIDFLPVFDRFPPFGGYGRQAIISSGDLSINGADGIGIAAQIDGGDHAVAEIASSMESPQCGVQCADAPAGVIDLFPRDIRRLDFRFASCAMVVQNRCHLVHCLANCLAVMRQVADFMEDRGRIQFAGHDVGWGETHDAAVALAVFRPVFQMSLADSVDGQPCGVADIERMVGAGPEAFIKPADEITGDVRQIIFPQTTEAFHDAERHGRVVRPISGGHVEHRAVFHPLDEVMIVFVTELDRRTKAVSDDEPPQHSHVAFLFCH